MARAIDYVTLSIILLVITFIWSAAAFSNWVAALIFSCALTLIVAVSVKYISAKRNKPYSPDRLGLEFSVKGSEYIIKIFKSILKNNEIESGLNYIVLENSILIALFRFNLLTINDMSGICSLAEKHDRKRVYVIARGIDRRAYQALTLDNIHLRVVKIRAVYKYLQKHNALPNLKPVRSRISLRAVVDMIFRRANVKSYLFSGAILIAVAFLTPLKTYYLVFGSISLLLAALSLSPLGNGSLTSPHIFNELDKQINSTQKCMGDEEMRMKTENTDNGECMQTKEDVKNKDERGDITD